MEPGPATAPPSDRPDPRAVGTRVGALFEAHGRMVHALCRMLLREREEAEDATQQTFLLAHRSLLGGVVPEQPEAWLATIARNECYRRLGRRAPDAVPLLDSDGGGGDPSRLADQRAEIEALCQALAELPPAQRQAVVLREFYGLSYREVAAALGVSGPAVESLLFKSRRRLQDRLRPIRVASNALILPLTLRDSLAAAIPGFSGAASGGAGAAAGGALLAKIGSAPLAAKVAAVVVAAGTGTGVTVAELHHSPGPSPAHAGLDLRADRQPEPAAATPRRVERGAPAFLQDQDEDDERDERDDDDEREDDEREDDDERDEAAERDEDEREERAERKEQARTASASEREQEDDDEDEPEQSATEQPEEPEPDEEVDETDRDTDDD